MYRRSFTIAFLVTLACSLASAQQAAFVDLTRQPKVPEPAPGTVRVAGGRLFDHPGPSPGTLTIGVTVLRLTEYTEGKSSRQAVDVEVANRGDQEISVPIGKDPVSLLSAGAQDRQYLSFAVYAGGRTQGLLSTRVAATNGEHPAVVRIHHGECVIFRVPVDDSRADRVRLESRGASLELKVAVSLWQVVVHDAADWNEQVGDEINSENAINWR